MGIQGFKECLQGTKVNLSDLIKNRMSGAPPLRIGVDLSVYAHQGIRARDIKEIYAMDFVAQPPMSYLALSNVQQKFYVAIASTEI